MFCALAVLICELISHPFAEMGISDDGPYILIARTLAATGHIVYNGWVEPMLAFQIYFSAGLIKLFGFSYSVTRLSSLITAMVLAFFLQRILVRCGVSERNATIATLALVLSPLYLVLSVTFMTDIFGLFGIVICFYGCLRALQSVSDRAAIAWLSFAVFSNALCGTSRQIAWLGILVIVPSTLWLLRSRRRVLFAGVAATLCGVLFLSACVQWLKHQPYVIATRLVPITFPFANPVAEAAHTIGEFAHTFLDIPFLLLPLFALFLPQIWKSRPPVRIVISIVSLAYLLLAIHLRISHADFLLEPTAGARGGWVGIHGIHEGTDLPGDPPVLIHTSLQVLLTVVSIGGLLGFVVSLLFPPTIPATTPIAETSSATLSWHQLRILLLPYAIAYTLLLIPRATNALYDRYMFGLLFVLLLCLVRLYQEKIDYRIPATGVLLVAVMAFFGIILTHNTFAFYRARVVLANELQAAGIPATSMDNGWEYNFDVEVEHAPSINYPDLVSPAHFYTTAPNPPPGPCHAFWYYFTPHVHPLYGASFDPNVCDGPAPFAPVHYARWPGLAAGTVYAVRYTNATKP
jgi:hypothetical protein